MNIRLILALLFYSVSVITLHNITRNCINKVVAIILSTTAILTLILVILL